MQNTENPFQKKPLLGIYFSAGFPFLNSVQPLLKALEQNDVDFVEVGIPYSDPMADGPVIEECHRQALQNGMQLDLMFAQLKEARPFIKVPVLLMGYFNPVFRYGIERFCDDCVEANVSAVILPDMPVEVYLDQYKEIFTSRGLNVVFLATPETPAARLKLIDKESRPFIYLVSSSATTGKTHGIAEDQIDTFRKIKKQVQKPLMVGFGISSAADYQKVISVADGAIIGSAFLKSLENAFNENKINEHVKKFVEGIKK